MTHSLPTRSSISPFRKNVNHSVDDTTHKHGSLKIVTTTSQKVKDETIITSPSRVRQRLSSLFRSSSPVVSTLKESFNNKRASLSTLSFTVSSPVITEEPQSMEPMDDSHSITTTLSSSGSSDHMPASPADTKALGWQQPLVTELRFEPTCNKSSLPPPAIPVHFATTRTNSSLAFQVHQILGSTLEEVDEEIDKDWENSRKVLRQSLVPSVKSPMLF
ncbi:hypothetical protein BDF21DRAFT_425014 [Thamnidium elegans]|uniref:Uncharacterized protein n=1 Tax=Thamnidium elegans TaxID=101142 RepID=A0A8H7VYQ0_9FUNG|nr:hypothetical protein INT48_001365 [Thamnidium elegans]KAI8070120.1 hypothetical protein BDF21DRAFT_425014 [Thamnidium elegans]